MKPSSVKVPGWPLVPVPLPESARGGDYYLDDLGSLNGTYVNRHRIESHRLEDGDELQVGKFKLTFLSQ